MVAESIRHLRGTVGGCSSTPSTSSTATAVTTPTPWRWSRPLPRPAPRPWSCATPTAGRCRGRWPTIVARGPWPRCRARSGCTSTTTAAARSPTRCSGLRPAPVQVQGTANGLGERCGNANLFTIMADLQLKRGLQLVPPDGWSGSTESPRRRRDLQPGRRRGPALRRPHGVRAQGRAARRRRWPRRRTCTTTSTRRRSATSMHLVVSELAGTVQHRAQGPGVRPRDRRRPGGGGARPRSRSASRRAGPTRPRTPRSSCCCAGHRPHRPRRGALPHPALPRVAWRGRGAVRHAARAGETRDAADRRRIARPRRSSRSTSTASASSGAGEGNGPVDALDHAFRNAVNGTWPELADVHLVDYKVRILEASSGTDAVTRVLVTSTDGIARGTRSGCTPTSWRRPGRRCRTPTPTRSCVARGADDGVGRRR